MASPMGADRWRRPRSTPRGPSSDHADQGQGLSAVPGHFGGVGTRHNFVHKRAQSTPNVGQFPSLRAVRGAGRRVSRVEEEQAVGTHDIWNPGSGDSESDVENDGDSGGGVIVFDD